MYTLGFTYMYKLTQGGHTYPEYRQIMRSSRITSGTIANPYT